MIRATREMATVSLICFSLLLVGCGSSTPDIDTQGDGQSVFEVSDVTTERFGALTQRNLFPETNMAAQATVVSAINDFSMDLYRAVLDAEPNEGSVLSGYSAAVALSLAYAGTAGDTQSALANMLGVDSINEADLHAAMNALGLALDSRNNDKLELHTANRVFVRPGFTLQDDYLDIATGAYGAPVTEVDFAGATDEATRLVNAWVADQTNDFIPTIIERFSPQTVFALLNTIFLDAGWQDTYQSAGAQAFNSLDGSTASVLSFTGRSQLPFLLNDELVALEIPYGGTELAMMIIMPSSLLDFESTLDSAVVDGLLTLMTDTDVNFTIPNWTDEVELDLVSLLAPAGFPANPWDFSRMVEGGGALLDVMARQKARIEVDENGTRATAVTLIAADESAPELVRIDRPFVYLIRDRVTNLVLFSGRVVSPGGEGAS